MHYHIQKQYMDAQNNKEIQTCKQRYPDAHKPKKGLEPHFELGYLAAMMAYAAKFWSV